MPNGRYERQTVPGIDVHAHRTATVHAIPMPGGVFGADEADGVQRVPSSA
jgi:hypothetical protein